MISRANWKEYIIYLSREECDFSIEDSFEDPRDQKFAKDGLANGNRWAWCSTRVRVICKATDIEASDFLAGCSYHSREDFMRPGGYYDDMVSECIDKVEAEKDRLRVALRHS